jgi:hypothetical protein
LTNDLKKQIEQLQPRERTLVVGELLREILQRLEKAGFSEVEAGHGLLFAVLEDSVNRMGALEASDMWIALGVGLKERIDANAQAQTN